MKLMIVDDDKQIREGIRYGIDWENYGFENVKDYGDGEEAYKDFSDFDPDIVVADIRMPRMDGLKLLEEIKKKKLECRYILLSAYSEFEYCQKALQLGANGYELKPVKPQKLIAKIMNEVKNLIEEKNEESKYFEMYEKSILHIISAGEAYENTDKLKELLMKKYNMHNIKYIYITMMRVESWKIEEPMNTQDLLKILQIKLEGFGGVVPLTDNQYICICQGENSSFLNINNQYNMKKCIQDLNKELSEKNVVLTTGISDVKGLKDIHIVYSQAQEAMNQNFYHEKGYCTMYALNSRITIEKLSEKKQKEYLDIIDDHKTENMEAVLNLLEEDIKNHSYTKQSVESFLKKIYFSLLKRGRVDTDYDRKYQTMTSGIHFEDSMKELKDLIMTCAEKDYLNYESYSPIVKKMCIFIKENYADQVSVEKLADELGKSPNYISAKFKKETGRPFTDFVVDTRMEEALRLLEKTNLSIYEIAERVGYSSYSYFSRAFKKKTGKSAGYYRTESI
ncbi:MAG: response regulator [Lachnospiraceae bacterium]